MTIPHDDRAFTSAVKSIIDLMDESADNFSVDDDSGDVKITFVKGSKSGKVTINRFGDSEVFVIERWTSVKKIVDCQVPIDKVFSTIKSAM